MNFARLHKDRKQLAYAEAIVRLRPTMDNMNELKRFRKEINDRKRSFLKVAN
ncbi:hypothetical protein [Cytobacillus pseudoceanisediminis]|jgi:hypothetical protein|uniref:hypothetical protein n=1 Tax=Cytobacillus pseudoceanisediminis TaxID=3051614 RepID=UPI003CF34EDE